MKFKIPAPVKVTIGDVVIDYELIEMVTHLVRRAREFNRDEAGARAGKRILDAFAAASNGEVELSDPDAKLLRGVASEPSCGWARHEIAIDMPTKTEAGVVIHKVKQRGQGAAVDYLPLIDALPNV